MDLSLLSSLLVGAGLGCAAWSGSEQFGRAFAFMENDFTDKLRRMRIRPRNLRMVLVGWLVVTAAAAAVIWIALGMPIIGLLVGVLLFCVPWFYLRRMAEQRRLQIEDQLADAMVSLSSAIRAGLSLAQAMEILARQCPPPIAQEFQQIYGEYQMGKTLETCLVETKARLKSENFALFAAAMEASRQSGGRLNETVERIAYSVRELQRLERKIQSETAQARASAFYMSLAPPAFLFVYYFLLDPESTSRLFTELPGQMMLATAAILNILAYFWARRILSPEI
ncbi:MAG: type II secretion system F family protein [Planctomycetaceae bacterium]